MSRPRYEGFGTDLDALQEKLDALEKALTDEFSAKFEKKKMKDPAAGYYRSMKAHLASLKRNIGVLKDGEISPEELAGYSEGQRDAYNKQQGNAWATVREFIQEYRPENMPTIPYKGVGEIVTDQVVEERIRQHEESFTRELDDPDVRRIWNLSQQLSDLSLDTDMIEQRDKYQSLKGEIDEHCNKVQQFSSKLREFDVDISKYKDYGEVVKAKFDAEKRLKEAQAEYDEQHSAAKEKELQDLENLREKHLHERLEGTKELNEKMAVSQNIIDGYYAELKEMDRQILQETQADNQRKAETEWLYRQVDQNTEQISKLEAESSSKAEEAEKYRKDFEEEQNKLTDLKKGLKAELEKYGDSKKDLARYQAMVGKRSNSADMAKAAANEADLAGYYQNRIDAQKMLNEYLLAKGTSTDLRETNKKYTQLFKDRFQIDKKRIAAINESNGELLASYIQAQVEDNTRSIKETLDEDASLTKLNQAEAAIHKQKLEEIQRLGDEGKSEELKPYTNAKANQKAYTNLLKVSENAKSAVNNEADLAYAYTAEVEAKQVYDEYRMELEGAGLDKLRPDEREQLLSKGRAYSKIEKSAAMQHLKKVNQEVSNAFKMRDIQDKYCKALKEVCHASDSSVEEALASTETLEHYLSDSVEGHKRSQEETIRKDKKLQLDPDERAIHDEVMGSINKAYIRIGNQNELMQKRESLYVNAKVEMENARIKKSELEEQNAEHTKKIQFNEAGGDLPKYLQEKQELIEKINAEQQNLNAYGAASQELMKNNEQTAKEIKALEDKRTDSELDRNDAENHLKEAAYCEKRTTELVNQQQELVSSRKELDEKLNPRGENSAVSTMWDRSCHRIADKMKNFRDTANYGKEKGHKDGQHYQEMMTKLDELLNEAGGGMVNRDPEKLQRKLDEVGQAAQAYINTRNKDWFKSSSTIRQTRLDYADRLVKYAAKAVSDLQKMTGENEKLKEKEKDLLTSKVDQRTYGDKLFDNMKTIANNNIQIKKENERQAKMSRLIQQNKMVNQNNLNNRQIRNDPPAKRFGE